MMRIRTVKVAVLAFGFVLAACIEQTAATPRNSGDLTIREASEQPVSGWVALKFADSTLGEIYVAPTPALTLDDIQNGEQTRDEAGRPAIMISFTKAGADKMRKFTSEHIGKKAAIVFKGQVMNAPMILAAISSRVIMTKGDLGLSAEEVQSILTVINQK